MSLPTEINLQRIKGDDYLVTFDVSADYSDYTLTLQTETGTVSPSIVTASSITFPGDHFATLDLGLHAYKVKAEGLSTRTLIVGVIQIVDDGLQVTP